MRKVRYGKIMSIILLVFACGICLPIYGEEKEHEGMQVTKKQVMNKGDYISFGNYNNVPIVWQVVHQNEKGESLLVAKDIITFKAFDASEHTTADYRNWGSNYWETSNLRKWLNSDEKKVDFGVRDDVNKTPYNKPDSMHVKEGINPYDTEPGFLTTFTEQEKALIVECTQKTFLDGANISIAQGGEEVHLYVPELEQALANSDKAKYVETTDLVFILDLVQLHEYVVKNNLPYKRMPTKQAIEQCSEEIRHTLHLQEEACYWVRTPRVTETNVLNDGASVRIKFYDDLILNQDAYNGAIGVVPALYIENEYTITAGQGNVEKPYAIQ